MMVMKYASEYQPSMSHYYCYEKCVLGQIRALFKEEQVHTCKFKYGYLPPPHLDVAFYISANVWQTFLLQLCEQDHKDKQTVHPYPALALIAYIQKPWSLKDYLINFKTQITWWF